MTRRSRTSVGTPRGQGAGAAILGDSANATPAADRVGHVGWSPDYATPERWEIRSLVGLGTQRMWLCSDCKARVDQHDNFCRRCGLRLIRVKQGPYDQERER